jgi:Vacuolar protein sorting-associated protein 26
MAPFFFSTPVDIDVVLEDGDDRQTVDVKLEKGRREKAPLYMDGESVKGAVTVRPKDGKRLEHTGIKVQFIGSIGMLRQSLRIAKFGFLYKLPAFSLAICFGCLKLGSRLLVISVLTN